MSMWDDYALEVDLDQDIRYMEIEQEANEGYWTTKDGKMIHVSDMTESHIRNTINFIKKRDSCDMYLPWILVFEKELERRGLQL